MSTFSFAIPIPDLEGPLHFQVQASLGADFSPVAVNGFSLSSQTRWFYFNPASGAGGAHVAFPSAGINGSSLAGHPVYFRFLASDLLSEDAPYYVRWRVWEDGQEGSWNSAPPLYLA